MRVGFSPEAIVQIHSPEQGINNQTSIVQQTNGPDLVIKVRPVSGKSTSRFRKAGKNNPYWPRYTQELFGPYPNGDIATLPEITHTLEAHGGLRVPHVYLDDTSVDLVPAPYLVSERLSGVAFDWSARQFTTAAARQLGEHLARLHNTTRGRTFGIYARHDDYPRRGVVGALHAGVSHNGAGPDTRVDVHRGDPRPRRGRARPGDRHRNARLLPTRLH
jgi:hypothetical protein